MTAPEENSVEPRALLLAIFTGLVAFGVACAVFWSFDYPWTLRGDNKAVMFPMNLEAFRLLMSGRVPEWTDKIWGGFPLLADPTTMALYWPNYLGFLVTTEPHLRAYDFATAVHSGILVSGVVYLLRLLGVRPLASLLGGAFIFVAPMHVWYASSMITGYAPVTWWPWMLVSAELIGRRGMTPGPMILGWLSLASCALVYPEFALYGATVAALWLLVHGRQSVAQRIVAAVVVPVGGLALAAPQLLPTALFFPETNRGDVEELRRYDLTQIYFSPDTFLYPGTEEFVPSFLGIATLVVAFFGVVSAARRSRFLATLALVTFVLALGFDTPLYPAFRELPGFGLFRQAMKLKLLTELAVVLLFSIGVDHLFRQIVETTGRRFALLIVVLALMENFTYIALRIPTGVSLPGADDESFTSLYDKMFDSNLVRFVLMGSKSPLPRITENVNLRSLPAVAGVPTLRGGPNALVPARHRILTRALGAPPGPTAAEMEFMAVEYDLSVELDEVDRADDTCLQRAMLRGLLLSGRLVGTCMYYNHNRPSRFVVASVVRHASDVDSMVEEVADELIGGRVVVTEGAPRDSCDIELPNSSEANVQRVEIVLDEAIPVVAPPEEIRERSHPFGRAGVIDHQPGEIALLATSNRPAFLIVKESYFRGWEASVDGEPVPVYPAAGLFFAVPIPSGQHEIDLQYKTPGFMDGTRIAIGWIVFVCLAELLRRAVSARRSSKE